MPYKMITQPPNGVKNNLPKHAQEIYQEAFNSAEEQYGEESRAHRVAWGAVERKVRKERKRRLGGEVAFTAFLEQIEPAFLKVPVRSEPPGEVRDSPVYRR